MITEFKGGYAYLSNFYDPCFVYYDGGYYRNSEAAYQAAKAVDPSIREMFYYLHPEKAKRRGKTILIRKDWDNVKERVMRAVVHAKFTQHPELAGALINTGSEELVEGNYWHDNYFGDCKCPLCRDKPGLNVLGRILMDEREIQRGYYIRGWDEQNDESWNGRIG